MKLTAIVSYSPYITSGKVYEGKRVGDGPFITLDFDDRGWFGTLIYTSRFAETAGIDDVMLAAPAPKVEVKDTNPKEKDPFGKDAHEPGSKLDHGKVRPALVLGGFARALLEVSKVGTFGATKYTDNGWQEVPNGVARYDDANMRHWLNEKAGQPNDTDTGLLHAAHSAWNALARLDLIIRSKENA